MEGREVRKREDNVGVFGGAPKHNMLML